MLSDQQLKAFDAISRWLRDPSRKRFVLSGYAGTGKTTLAKYIDEQIGDVYFLAYTGKAVEVLRSKGCQNSSTIHGYIYTPVVNKFGTLEFMLKDASEVEKYKLVIVDEYSMVSEEMINDLESISKKVLYLGDNFQLPPIYGVNNFKIDFQLTEVHRQALDSNIIRIVTDIRSGITPEYCEYDDFVFKRKNQIDKDTFMSCDQILVGRNETRRDWISKYRAHNGNVSKLPNKGEKIICLKNNKSLSIFNGMTGPCQNAIKVTREETPQVIHVDFNGREKIQTWSGCFLGVEPNDFIKSNKHMNLFDYGCVITVHKSQGSEWDKVLVYNEPIGKTNIDKWRWMYTALTRARKKVYLVD